MVNKIYTTARLGESCVIQDNVIIGAPGKDMMGSDEKSLPATVIGKGCVIRSGTVIYAGAVIGNNLRTGHNALIREGTRIGNNVLVGTNSVVDDHCEIGDNVSIQSSAYIPTNTKIGSFVFIGPCACFTNDPCPVRAGCELKGPILEDHVTIGANATLLPGVRIGEGSFVAAGAVVTKDVGRWKLAIGVPAVEKELPDKLKSKNRL